LPPGSTVTNGDTSDATDVNTPLADLASDANVARPIVAGGTGASTAAGALVNFGVTSTAAELNSVQTLAGRNIVINGSGRVNQRGYVSAAATGAAKQFTLDRWAVLVSGQNLTSTGTDAGRTMTAPAGGVAQVIEGANIVGGTYVLNWTGTATATVDGVAVVKGGTFTLTANTNATLQFTGGTFTDAQIELGTVATAFERGDMDLLKCQQYYLPNIINGATMYPLITGSSLVRAYTVSFPIPMRAAPTVSSNATNIGALTGSSTIYAASFSGTAGSDVQCIINAFTADAEIAP